LKRKFNVIIEEDKDGYYVSRQIEAKSLRKIDSLGKTGKLRSFLQEPR
jgi:predicted RNase H-like HicB family nuclease